MNFQDQVEQGRVFQRIMRSASSCPSISLERLVFNKETVVTGGLAGSGLR